MEYLKAGVNVIVTGISGRFKVISSTYRNNGIIQAILDNGDYRLCISRPLSSIKKILKVDNEIED